ncbi:EAL domain-containing protein [Nocardioides sp. W3-2-3]|nr:EAL domain-containing protein [Nocardioides convexus]
MRRDSPLLQTLVDLVAEHRVSLALEVSERAFDGWTDEIDEIARWLRTAGISLAIDDFGAGYSTYALLNHWSWDLVKARPEPGRRGQPARAAAAGTRVVPAARPRLRDGRRGHRGRAAVGLRRGASASSGSRAG